MQEFKMTRWMVFAYWANIRYYHSIGYMLQDDVMIPKLPKGCTPASIFCGVQ